MPNPSPNAVALPVSRVTFDRLMQSRENREGSCVECPLCHKVRDAFPMYDGKNTYWAEPCECVAAPAARAVALNNDISLDSPSLPKKDSRWVHYKGDVIVVRGISRHSETKEPMVEYVHGEPWCRPFSMWNQSVKVRSHKPGIIAVVKRFTEIDCHVQQGVEFCIRESLRAGIPWGSLCFLCGEICPREKDSWIACRTHGRIRVVEHLQRYEWMRVSSYALHPDSPDILDYDKPCPEWDALAKQVEVADAREVSP